MLYKANWMSLDSQTKLITLVVMICLLAKPNSVCRPNMRVFPNLCDEPQVCKTFISCKSPSIE